LLLDLQPLWMATGNCPLRSPLALDSEANANHVEQLAKIWETSFYCYTAGANVEKRQLKAALAGYQALQASLRKMVTTALLLVIRQAIALKPWFA